MVCVLEVKVAVSEVAWVARQSWRSLRSQIWYSLEMTRPVFGSCVAHVEKGTSYEVLAR
jgi:hypothetical protein